MTLVTLNQNLGEDNKMKKLSITILVIVVLFTCLNPFMIFLHRNRYIEENMLKSEIAENLKMCKEDNLQGLAAYDKEELIAIFSELQNVEFSIVKKQETVDIILKNNIDESAIRTTVPTKYSENSDKIFQVMQLFEADDINYVLCKYLLKNGNGYSLFAFTPTETLAELLQEDILYAGKFCFDMKVQVYDAIRSTAKHFLPVSVIAILLFIPYLRKTKAADTQTRKILTAISKIGCIAVPAIMVALIIKVYTS